MTPVALDGVIEHHGWNIEPVVIYDLMTDRKVRLGYRCGACCVAPAWVFRGLGARSFYRWAVMFRGRILLWLWKWNSA